MSHLLRLIAAVLVLAVPGVALAQCTKDTECKGDRVCERGACVTPGERTPAPPPAYTPPPPPPAYTAPPPPPSQPAARPPPARHLPASEGPWEAGTKKNIVSYNPLSTISALWGAAQAQNVDPGLSIIQFTVAYERALLPNFSLFATLTPNLWSDPAGSLLYVGITVGGKYYFFGDAPAGFWGGGEVGTLPLNLGAGLEIEVGYQWLLESGIELGVTGGIVFAGAQAPQVGLAIGPGLGAYVGWNF